MFGAADSLLHYNVFSELVAEQYTHLFGMPPICFCDTFAALAPLFLATQALAVFTLFCATLGLPISRPNRPLARK